MSGRSTPVTCSKCMTLHSPMSIKLKETVKTKMDTVGHRIFLRLLILFKLALTAHSATTFEFMLISYSNSDHTLNNGSCCDDTSTPCTDRCDNRFQVCLDANTTDFSFDSCNYALIDTGEVTSVGDQDDFVFPSSSSAGKTLSISTAWTEHFIVKVHVWDVDPEPLEEKVGEFYRTINHKASPDKLSAPVNIYTLGDATGKMLSFSSRVYCPDDYFGKDCFTHCRARNDDLFGHYVCNTTSGAKICLSGWTGSDCNEDYDECSSNPCQHGAQCVNGSDVYNCTCLEGFSGTNCEIDVDDCLTMPCENGAICHDLVNGFNCTCATGYHGDNCEVDTDECLQFPCRNNGTCTNYMGGFNCTCAEGFEGTSCETESDECASSPCLNKGTCWDGLNSFNCSCADGFVGQTCEIEVDECGSNACLNNATCADQVDSYRCECSAGFTGVSCEQIIRENCEDSLNRSTCLDGADNFTCQCFPSYHGALCEEVSRCGRSPCLHNATCYENVTDAINGYSCQCSEGYEGKTCSEDWMSKYWYAVVICSAILCLGVACGVYCYKRVKARKENKITYSLQGNNLNLASPEEPISSQTDGLFWKRQPITVENPSYGLAFKPDYQTPTPNQGHSFDGYDKLFSEDYTPICLTPHLNRLGHTPERLIVQSIEDFHENWLDPV